VLLVQGWSNTWYQDGVRGLGKSLNTSIKEIEKLCQSKGVREVFCSGQSMGGYGALLFAGLVKGARAIAFGAETILDLPHSQYSRKANRDVKVRHPDLAKSFKDGLNALLISGERDPIDVYCANHLMGVPGVEVRTMRFVGHGPAGYLRNRARLVPTLRNFMSGEPLPPMPEYGDALSHGGFPRQFYHGWCALRSKNYAEAVYELQGATESYPASDEAHHLLGQAYEGVGDISEAMSSYAVANSIVARKDSMVSFASCLRRLGSDKGSLYVCKTTKNKWPDYAPAHFGEGLSYMKMGRKMDARKCFQRACELEPLNAHYRARLERT
jgi:tetratricopeptide (TPR) repeat protein